MGQGWPGGDFSHAQGCHKRWSLPQDVLAQDYWDSLPWLEGFHLSLSCSPGLWPGAQGTGVL